MKLKYKINGTLNRIETKEKNLRWVDWGNFFLCALLIVAAGLTHNWLAFGAAIIAAMNSREYYQMRKMAMEVVKMAKVLLTASEDDKNVEVSDY